MNIPCYAFIGKQQSGKSTAAFILSKKFENSRTLRFADPIYDTLSALEETKHRAFMQEFGEMAKKHFGEMVFVNLFVRKARFIIDQKYDGRQGICQFVNAIFCDDVRRSYELDACKELGFKTVFIEADDKIRQNRATKNGFKFIENHISETEIPSLKKDADFMIINNGTLNQFEKAILTLHKTLNDLEEIIRCHEQTFSELRSRVTANGCVIRL